MPEPNSLVVAVGDVSGKGVPAALYSAFAGELVRSRTFRRRYTSDRSSPAGVLASMNTILYQRQLEEYYCTLCYAIFDLKRRTVVMANSGLPYPIRCRQGDGGVDGSPCAKQIELAGRAARIVSRIVLRRGELRSGVRRCLRVLQRRRVRSGRRARARNSARRGSSPSSSSARPGRRARSSTRFSPRFRRSAAIPRPTTT